VDVADDQDRQAFRSHSPPGLRAIGRC
jgi:hypothetical protein